MKIHIETERLLIREMREEDEQGMFELGVDPEVNKYVGNKPITTMEEAQGLIKFIQLQYKENGIGRFTVIEKKTGDFIGWTGLKLITEETNKHIRYYDMGYRLIRKYWGKGYATETAVATLFHGFDTMNLSEIFAIANVENLASNAILKKVGLKFIETFNYHGDENNFYRISKEEWMNIKMLNNRSL